MESLENEMNRLDDEQEVDLDDLEEDGLEGGLVGGNNVGGFVSPNVAIDKHQMLKKPPKKGSDPSMQVFDPKKFIEEERK